MDPKRRREKRQFKSEESGGKSRGTVSGQSRSPNLYVSFAVTLEEGRDLVHKV